MATLKMPSRSPIEFALWAMTRQGVPTPTEIRQRFGVSRATSYRWLSAYNGARRRIFPFPEASMNASTEQQTTADAACPVCGCDLTEFGGIDIQNVVNASDDPEHRARLDLLVTCSECESALNVFVPLDQLTVMVRGVAQ